MERMAALLRFTLDSHSGGLVGFDQEMKIVRDYLEIEQARLGGRLRWGIELKGDFDGLKIPPLSIQTLVENSIKLQLRRIARAAKFACLPTGTMAACA